MGGVGGEGRGGIGLGVAEGMRREGGRMPERKKEKTHRVYIKKEKEKRSKQPRCHNNEEHNCEN